MNRLPFVSGYVSMYVHLWRKEPETRATNAFTALLWPVAIPVLICAGLEEMDRRLSP